MSATDWAAIAGGLASIAWVNWYFFATARHAAVASVTVPGTVPTLRVVVQNGYEPATIRVPAGRPVRLVFDRTDSSSCTEEVVFPDFGIRRFLPTGKPVTLELTPPKAGRYEFMCGMSMIHGVLIAEDAG
jgi:plastocyanin domain-containing protein